MLLFYIVPIIIAMIKRYKPSSIWKAWFIYPLFFVELVHLTFQISVMFGYFGFVRFSTAIQYAFNLSLLFPIIAYKLYRPALIGASGVVAGSMLNRIVIQANGGKMPVFPTLSRLTGFYEDGLLERGIDNLHVLMTGDTKLNFLGDYFDLGFSIMSIGDLLIHAFISIIIFYTIKQCFLKDKQG